MAKIDIIMPRMGESVMEATIIQWFKNVGDRIGLDEDLLEVATDKVNNTIPSPSEGVIVELLYPVDATVEVGKVIAVIETGATASAPKASPAMSTPVVEAPKPEPVVVAPIVEAPKPAPVAQVPVQPQDFQTPKANQTVDYSASTQFLSPLVKSIAQQEGISLDELQRIAPTGKDGRLTKDDVINYLINKATQPAPAPVVQAPKATPAPSASAPIKTSGNIAVYADDEVIEMDRMRRLIAEHMIMSKQTSPHVQSFIEVDMTSIVQWRARIKDEFQAKHGQKITFTPIILEAVAKAIKDYPMVNVSVDGTKVIKRGHINLGMATALPSGNLIVPVIKDADQKNLVAMTSSVNDLANRARNNKLASDDIQGGTFTVTNVGTFGSVFGTPIINQPQVAILSLGAIRKRPVVLETNEGDVIGIRSMMYLSLSYDHRIVDGALGGMLIQRIKEYLENFDTKQTV